VLKERSLSDRLKRSAFRTSEKVSVRHTHVPGDCHSPSTVVSSIALDHSVDEQKINQTYLISANAEQTW